ncbi:MULTISPECIES: hypothetical protein [Bacillus]|uniref:hypothetical protein n=1 Tax=Bacillus TaxID=1386 RepID=UPI00077AF9E6|nr:MULTISPECIES: hypothetical protein [Bacillus]KAB2372786.1 hypothetical protein F8510_24775 [Bacillus sp. RM2(2019)]KXY52286.1 hypothetical protein AT261_05370 [Bacillus cereus]PGW51472.1 hypothetical protein COE14_23735 [Bacillus thuringiensis]
MKNRSRIRKVLYGLGSILVFWGLMMLNIINGINLFEHTNKLLAAGVIILGIILCIISNFLRKPGNPSN